MDVYIIFYVIQINYFINLFSHFPFIFDTKFGTPPSCSFYNVATFHKKVAWHKSLKPTSPLLVPPLTF